MAKARAAKPTPKSVAAETAAATDALEDAEAAANAGDPEEFDAAIEEAREKIAAIEGDITWIKAELTKQGEATTPINSTLETLSGQMTELQTRLTELTEKFQSLTLRKPSEPSPEPEPTPKPPMETPAVQAVKEIPEPEAPPAKEPSGNTPAAPEPPKRIKRFI